MLGAFWASQRLEFAAAFTGTLSRQKDTAWEVAGAYQDGGRPFPGISRDCGWDEFDFIEVFRALAPQLCADDAEFRTAYEELERQECATRDQPEAEVHRHWTPCDIQLMATWIAGRYPYDGESWPAFRERVLDCRSRLASFGPDDNIVVFTSATPIGIWTAKALDIEDVRAMRLAGVLLNSSFSVLRIFSGELRLYSFNAVSHLAKPDLHTYR